MEAFIFYYTLWFVFTRLLYFIFGDNSAVEYHTRYFVPWVGELYVLWYFCVWFLKNW